MTKLEMLRTLQSLVQGATISETDPDDLSGLNRLCTKSPLSNRVIVQKENDDG